MKPHPSILASKGFCQKMIHLDRQLPKDRNLDSTKLYTMTTCRKMMHLGKVLPKDSNLDSWPMNGVCTI